MKRFKLVVFVIIAGFLASTVSGCGYMPQSEQKEIAAFYTGFVKEATSLDAAQIEAVYTELKKENVTGQDANTVRNKMFAKFNTINPDFFSKLHLTDSSYSEVGKAYSTILLLSLATKGEGVDITMPSDAVTTHKDDELGKRVYEIDRKQITAVVSESLGVKITREERNSLSPVRILKENSSWKVIADNNMLSEVGTPLSDKITAPATTSK